ncbi:MAG: hypothetical protein LV481_00130 [Methylacidiphilales bacterium]|nr:hypothetical protein [Candidatus Methylacidiphilales bacterium]
MKSTLKGGLTAVILAGMLAAANLASAETTQSTTVTTTSSGTVSELDPNVITIHSISLSQPVGYTYTKTTAYVDQNGNPVSIETVKSGTPVTIYYSRQGNQTVASKVVVQTSTTTTAPSP